MSDSAIPQELRYTKDHEWVRLEGNMAVVGITDHAQEALGAVTYVDLPTIGRKVQQSEELAAVESAKAASDIFAPVSGEVAEVNAALDETPDLINTDSYGEGWICKLKGVNPSDVSGLLTADQYRTLLEQEEK